MLEMRVALDVSIGTQKILRVSANFGPIGVQKTLPASLPWTLPFVWSSLPGYTGCIGKRLATMRASSRISFSNQSGFLEAVPALFSGI